MQFAYNKCASITAAWEQRVCVTIKPSWWVMVAISHGALEPNGMNHFAEVSSKLLLYPLVPFPGCRLRRCGRTY